MTGWRRYDTFTARPPGSVVKKVQKRSEVWYSVDPWVSGMCRAERTFFYAALAVIARVHWHVTRLAGVWYGLMHCHSATRIDIMSLAHTVCYPAKSINNISLVRFVIPRQELNNISLVSFVIPRQELTVSHSMLCYPVTRVNNISLVCFVISRHELRISHSSALLSRHKN